MATTTFSTNTTLLTPTSPTITTFLQPKLKCQYDFIAWYHVPLLVIGILIIAINFPILIFVKTSRILKRNAGNLILMGLSLVDLLTGFQAIFHVTPTYYFMAVGTCDNHLFKDYDTAGYLLFKICLLGSIGHLLLLAGERMIRLFRPFHFKSMIVSKKVIPFVSCVWVVSICLPLLELAYQNTEKEVFFLKLHVTITIVGFWILPMVLLLAQYVAMLILIYKFQQKHLLDFKNMFLRYKAFFIYFAMFVSFLVLSLPYFGVRIIIAFTDKFYGISSDMLRVISLLRYVPSLTNPFLYCVLKEDFQQALWSRRKRFSLTFKSDSDPLVLYRLSIRRQNENNTITAVVTHPQNQHRQEALNIDSVTEDTHHHMEPVQTDYLVA